MVQMAVIILVRHGESTANVKDIVTSSLNGSPLTKRGAEQARTVAGEIAKVGAARLLTSPLVRTRQTAMEIGKALGVEPISDYRLREREFGELEGVKKDKWMTASLLGKTGKHTEAWGSIRDRTDSFIDEVSKLNGITVAVTHEVFIRSALCDILNLGNLQGFAIKVGNCSLTAIRLGRKQRIIAMGLPMLPEGVVKEIAFEAGE
jgi:probable phosphoglycerate mutase